MKQAALAPRNYGIDLLRICSMFMIVILHLLGKGGVLANTAFLSLKYEVLWFLEIGCFCAVNCYALISGYVGYNSIYRYTSFILLWLRVVFYTLAITTLFQIFYPKAISVENWIAAFTPIMSNQYWYFSGYLVLFLSIPILNLALCTFSKKQMAAILGSMFLLFSVLTVIYQRDVFILANGYSGWWLIFLYLIGGYVGKYDLVSKSKLSSYFWKYLGVIFLTWLVKFCVEIFFPVPIIYNGLITYNSFTIVLAAIFLLQFFADLKLSPVIIRIIKIFTPTVFSVYLIHVHPLVWNNIWHLRFTYLSNLSIFPMLCCIFTIASVIFVGCCFIDLIREKLFACFYIKEKLLDAERKWLGNLWN